MRTSALCSLSKRPTSLHTHLVLPALHRIHRCNSSTEQTRNAKPRTVFSGIQPTGVPHLGNYLGAILPWLRAQSTLGPNDRMLISIVDLHALTSLGTSSSSHTTQVEPLRVAKRKLLAILLAVGLDPQKTTLFYQSDVPQHAELHWILSCNAPVGSLMRMTQWKTKLRERYPHIKSEDDAAREAFLGSSSSSEKDGKGLKLGLFSYPVLQAADVLLYRATHIPVGEDQVQHIEFARNEAVRFNSRFATTDSSGSREEVLALPRAMISPFRRVMSLSDPSSKMSKSAPSEKSRILLSDDQATIQSRFASALTDSVTGPITYDQQNRPGIANLCQILAHSRDAQRESNERPAMDGERLRSLIEEQVSSLSLKEFKALVAREVDSLIAPIREDYFRLMNEHDGRTLDLIAAQGAEQARTIAQQTMRDVRDALGL